MASKIDFSRDIPGQLDDEFTWKFPTISGTNSHSSETYWTIVVKVVSAADHTKFLPFNETYLHNKPLAATINGWIYVYTGVVGGKERENVATIVSAGKGTGKAATNVICQALRDAQGSYDKQLRKTARNMTTGDIVMYPPMLAQLMPDDYEVQDVLVTRKYNGLRAVAVLSGNAVIMYSRDRIVFPGLNHIKEELLPILLANPGMYYDGEVYKHGVELQLISGATRKTVSMDKHDYMIYDCFKPAEPSMTAEARHVHLVETIPADGVYVKLVESIEAPDVFKLYMLFDEFLAEGYEGAMIREPHSCYVYSYNSHHSSCLLKLKPTFDDEFMLVGWSVAEKGKSAGAIMVQCRTPNGHTFKVTPAMEIAARKELAAEMGRIERNGKTVFDNHWLGQFITIIYDEKSTAGVPLRARTQLHTRIDPAKH